MNLPNLIEELKKRREEIDVTIRLLQSIDDSQSRQATRATILKTVRARKNSVENGSPKKKRGRPKKKVHWLQTPEGRQRMSDLMKARHKMGLFKRK